MNVILAVSNRCMKRETLKDGVFLSCYLFFAYVWVDACRER